MQTTFMHFHTTGVHDHDYPLRVGMLTVKFDHLDHTIAATPGANHANYTQEYTTLNLQLPPEITPTMREGMAYCGYSESTPDVIPYSDAARTLAMVLDSSDCLALYDQFGLRFLRRTFELAGTEAPLPETYLALKPMQKRYASLWLPNGKYGRLAAFGEAIGIAVSPTNIASQLDLFAHIYFNVEASLDDYQPARAKASQ